MNQKDKDGDKDNTIESPHISVLLQECIDCFKDIKNGYIIDCTCGFGGHSEAILKSNQNIKLICNDQDEDALKFAKKRLEPFGERVIFEKGRFSKIIEKYRDFPIKGVLADIGVSSFQLDEKERGFAFDSQNLDMRMDCDQNLSAYDVVNRYNKDELEKIFANYGELREAKKLSYEIVQMRQKAPIQSAKELSSIASKVIKGRGHNPSTLVFQAIRIEVNDELGELERLLGAIKEICPKDCTIAIITFHSLEDRIVKNSFKEFAKSCICPPTAFKCGCGNNHELGVVLTKKPIEASVEEIRQNSRSRSAKLRIFQTKK